MEHQNSSLPGALLLFTSATSMAAWLGGAERGTGRGRCYRNKLEKKEPHLWPGHIPEIKTEQEQYIKHHLTEATKGYRMKTE
jgi:hypothetical protein